MPVTYRFNDDRNHGANYKLLESALNAEMIPMPPALYIRDDGATNSNGVSYLVVETNSTNAVQWILARGLQVLYRAADTKHSTQIDDYDIPVDTLWTAFGKGQGTVVVKQGACSTPSSETKTRSISIPSKTTSVGITLSFDRTSPELEATLKPILAAEYGVQSEDVRIIAREAQRDSTDTGGVFLDATISTDSRHLSESLDHRTSMPCDAQCQAAKAVSHVKAIARLLSTISTSDTRSNDPRAIADTTVHNFFVNQWNASDSNKLHAVVKYHVCPFLMLACIVYMLSRHSQSLEGHFYGVSPGPLETEKERSLLRPLCRMESGGEPVVYARTQEKLGKVSGGVQEQF